MPKGLLCQLCMLLDSSVAGPVVGSGTLVTELRLIKEVYSQFHALAETQVY